MVENIHVTDLRYAIHGHGQGRKKYQVSHAELTYTLLRCPSCDMDALRRNGHTMTHIRVNGLTDSPMMLELNKQRWRCRSCGATCTRN